MARSIRKSVKKRGGAYGSGGSALGSPLSLNSQRGGSKRQTRKSRRQTLTRKQKLSRKQRKSRKSFLSTLNQMGGYIRDGSSQFFKILKGEQ